MSPAMPQGIVDALKMLPAIARLKDLMPKTARTRPVRNRRENGTLDECQS